MIKIVLVTCYHGTYVYSTEISDNLTHNMWYHESDILSPHAKSKINSTFDICTILHVVCMLDNSYFAGVQNDQPYFSTWTCQSQHKKRKFVSLHIHDIISSF